MAVNWGKVEVAVELAKGIAFDECHKIYVLMDDGQMAQMKEYGYDPLIAVTADEQAGAAFRAAGASVEHEVSRPFHFGRELRRIAARRGCTRLVVIGAGAGALLEVADLRGIRERLEAAAPESPPPPLDFAPTEEPSDADANTDQA